MLHLTISTRQRLPKILAAATLAVALAAGVPAQPTTAASAVNVMYGYVEHVSTDNIKIYDIHEKKSMGFLLLPKFDQVFSSDGKTTYQMRDVKPGVFVKLYFDQKMLGARHADRIFLYHTNAQNPPSRRE